MKKDEDADQVMIKLDRTSVFQDGMQFRNAHAHAPGRAGHLRLTTTPLQRTDERLL